jgi:maltose alpha-D-glucosyltransferase/alpha-amylase
MSPKEAQELAKEPRDLSPDDNPHWYKDAVIYEVHVRSFYDGNGDGIGDFQGVLEKLDYIRDLGVTAIWLLPFYPSPLKDDGYDITDYFNIHPDYGDLKTFRRLLREAHSREIRVITEMVLNHTSDKHPWFQKARSSSPGSVWRDYYVWSDTPDKYRDARIIFKDFENSNWTWDPITKDFYWHRFYSHQPDLNYDSEHVQNAMIRVIDFWLGMGVDGIRLDAVPYLYEREGTNCENLPETHAYLKKLRAHVDAKFKNRMLLAEANQWPEDAAAYFGGGDECHMAFHFPLMPRMFMAVEMEDRFPIIDILDQTPNIPASCQWALFLRNHDELTLEMVTDEERDYMYRVYAQDPRAKINLGIRRRLAPLLGNNRRKIELMFLLLFSLPGTPVIYYGDDIGMGDNYHLGDRNGVRTPMQWSPGTNAGFSLANPQELYLPVVIDPQYNYEAVNVSNQERDPSSILWWIKQTIALRKRLKAFGNGDLKVLLPGNSKVMAFIRSYQDETVLVVANLSRYPQQVEIDLAEYAGFTLEEVISKNRFQTIERHPYSITLGPYGYYWFLLMQEEAPACIQSEAELPLISARHWNGRISELNLGKLEETLPDYLRCLGWSGGSGRTIQEARILESLPMSGSPSSYLQIIRIDYAEGLPDLFLLPLAVSSVDEAQRLREKFPQSLIARLRFGSEEGVMHDGIYNGQIRENLLSMILHKRRVKGSHGSLIFYPRKAVRKPPEVKGLSSDILKISQNTAYIQFQSRFLLKLYRRLGEEADHEVEVVRLLTEHSFANIPAFEGSIEYRQPKSEPVSIGLLQAYVQSESDAWTYTLDEAGRFFERVLSRKEEAEKPPAAPESLLGIDPESIPPLVRELMGGVHLEMAQLLGRRTAEMHKTLASSQEANFSPISFTAIHQRSLYQSMRISASRTLQSLNRHMKRLPEEIQGDASAILASEKEILSLLRKVMERKLSGTRIRIHGDYHLAQLLYTGKDFFLFGFESGPENTMEERKLKRSPIFDLASMVVSFHSAAYSALHKHALMRKEDLPLLEPWEGLWFRYVSGLFISSYLKTAGDAPFLPSDRAELEVLLYVFLLDRSIHELGGNLERQESLGAPIKGILSLLKSTEKEKASMKIEK